MAQDDAEAAKWYRKAAEQGLAQAQLNLGECYRNGEGVDRDASEAVNLYRKAAAQGHAGGQCNLGLCYCRGVGVTNDYVEAYKWLSLASAQGDEFAKRNKSFLAQHMTPEQIAKGARLAREFKPSSAPKSVTSAPAR